MVLTGEVRSVGLGKTKKGGDARFYSILPESGDKFIKVFEGASRDGRMPEACAAVGEVVTLEVDTDFVFLRARLDAKPASLKKVAGI